MIKNFNTEAQKAATALSTTESTLSHINEGNRLIADGVMVQTSLPEKGDACVLDASLKPVFYTEASYNRSLLPAGWQQVGFVKWRRGRKVLIGRVLGSYKWSKYFMWAVTGYSLDGESHAFSFKVTVSGTEYTCEGNYSGTTLAEVAASMNAIVKDFNFGGQQYHVYVRSGELILQHDTYASYLAVTATGVTVTARVGTELQATSAMPRRNGQKSGVGASANLDRAMIYFRADIDNASYNPTSNVATLALTYPVCLPAYLGQSAYRVEGGVQKDYCSFLRSYYGEGEEGWMKFMKASMACYPSEQGIFYEPTYGNGRKNTYLLAGQKCEDHNGNWEANYLAFDAAAEFGFPGAKGFEAGDWYMDDIGEIIELKKDITYPAFYQKGVGSVSIAAANADVISRICAKMNLTQVGNSSGAWGSSRYHTNGAWNFYGSSGNAGNNYFYSAYQVIASTLYELPEAD